MLRSDFKRFNTKKFYVCALVGVLIKRLYETHSTTKKDKKIYILCRQLSDM